MRVLTLAWMALAIGSAIAIATPRAEANPDQVNGCRLASAEEISGAAGVTVTRALDRGRSGCTYYNGEDASRTDMAERPAASPNWQQPAVAEAGGDWTQPRRRIWPWLVGAIVVAIFIAVAWLVADIGIALVDQVRQHPVM